MAEESAEKPKKPKEQKTFHVGEIFVRDYEQWCKEKGKDPKLVFLASTWGIINLPADKLEKLFAKAAKWETEGFPFPRPVDEDAVSLMPDEGGGESEGGSPVRRIGPQPDQPPIPRKQVAESGNPKRKGTIKKLDPSDEK